ncbi:hypothetical protein [Rothia mucilaginosa]|jgi:conserved hypothetical protein|uniref:hypothetical protein n=1 Tax=Rothia mucilaginosa TaxID=43675 RepID=UPI001CB5EB6A|nr:hypothetical protein [uncultured Rothia sp.]MBF1679140.1 hypothetical protein [Rothia sp. (in: high G+C Gram-positive bacteria)]
MPLIDRKTARAFERLDAHDIAHRVSAYTYGNFLVLAALLSIYDVHALYDGTAILYIAGTGLTTYAAHVISEIQEHRVVHGDKLSRSFLRHALGNASPILSTTVFPVTVLVLAALLLHQDLSDGIFDLTIGLCLATVVWRIFTLNFVIARYRKEPFTFRTLKMAIFLTVIVVVLAAIKMIMTH